MTTRLRDRSARRAWFVPLAVGGLLGGLGLVAGLLAAGLSIWTILIAGLAIGCMAMHLVMGGHGDHGRTDHGPTGHEKPGGRRTRAG